MIYLQLYLEFFRVGLFAVGGGFATLPFLYELSDKTGWFTHQQLTDMLAISESTPGPIGVNTATYVGFTSAGILGAVIATLGLITPSIIVILLIARFLSRFSENKYVKAAFYGLRPASVGLILSASCLVIKAALFDPAALAAGSWQSAIHLPAVLLAAVIWFVLRKKPDLHPVVVLGISAVVGAVFGFAGA